MRESVPRRTKGPEQARSLLVTLTISSNGLVGVGIALSALAVAILGTAFGLKTLASAARSRRG